MGTLEILVVVCLTLLMMTFATMYHIRTKQVQTLQRELTKFGDELGAWKLACTAFKEFEVLSYASGNRWAVIATDHRGRKSRAVDMPDPVTAILTVDRQLRAVD